jgi:hypothetical protein
MAEPAEEPPSRVLGVFQFMLLVAMEERGKARSIIIA